MMVDSDFIEEMGDSEIPHVEYRVKNSAFGRRIRQFELVNHGYKLIEEFLLSAFDIYQSKINEAVQEFDMIKTISYFSAEFEKIYETGDNRDPLLEKRVIHIPTKVQKIDTSTDIKDHFQNDIIDHVVSRVDEVMIEGSGFTLGRIIELSVQMFKYEPLGGSRFMDLPPKLKNKRAIINLKNTDNECFKWSILAALHYDEVRAKSRTKTNCAKTYQRWTDELNFDGIDFPVRLNQIEKFMKQNKPLSINVYYFDMEKQRVCPLFLASKAVENRHIHLLLLTKATRKSCNVAYDVSTDSHYCWIKNLSALVSAQINKREHKISICDRCLNQFTSDEKLKKHRTLCSSENKCAIEMPADADRYERFRRFKNQLKTPFIIYADTETLLKAPEARVFSENCSRTAHQEHEVHSIGYYFKYENDESRSRYASYRGADCIDWFMKELTKIATEAFNYLEDGKPMKPLSQEEKNAFNEATFCHICEGKFKQNFSDVRVRDHCHLSGNYRGAAHQYCNLNYQISRTIPLVMHNLSGYDSHLLIRKLGCNKTIPGEIKIIPHNTENYISFIKTMNLSGEKFMNDIKIKFIDSMRFMLASLDSLASSLPHEKKHILKSECIKSGYHSDEMFYLLVRKGIFPYEHIDSYEKLEETALPPIEGFYSSLTDSQVSEVDYNHAQKVWNSFGIRTLGEYSDLYLKTDVLLLADVFENFRNMCHTTYSLDAAHYFSAPGLSFDAMLKYTNVCIELFTDPDMLLFIENGIRGGISQVNRRYVKANNIYMGEEYDSSKEPSYLMYLDGKYINISCLF